MSEPEQPPRPGGDAPAGGDRPAALNVKISDDELKGRYTNLLRITHTSEEFILDFINLVPPQGVVTARLVTSPGHLKRIIGALQTNLKRYEDTFGSIREAPDPNEGQQVH